MTQMFPLFIIGNDAVAPEVLRFLASLRSFSPSCDVNFIPFGEPWHLTWEIARTFRCNLIQDDFSVYENFGRALFDKDPPQQPYPYMLGKLRKLQIFDYPERAVYVDVDTIITCDIMPLLNKFSDCGSAFGYMSPSNGWVYENVDEAAPLLSRSHEFSTGFLFKNASSIKFKDVAEVIYNNLDLFHRVRRRGVVDQPLLNFFVDVTSTSVASIPEITNISGHTVADSRIAKLYALPDGRVVQGDDVRWAKQVAFLHAVGELKHGDEMSYLFRARLWEGFMTLYRADQTLALKWLTTADAWLPLHGE